MPNERLHAEKGLERDASDLAGETSMTTNGCEQSAARYDFNHPMDGSNLQHVVILVDSFADLLKMQPFLSIPHL